MKKAEQTVPISQLADLMDDCANEEGQWDGADVCEQLALLINQADGWKRCPEHGLYSATKPSCPFPFPQHG